MTDVGFVIAGYTVILGGLAAYAVLLLLRLRDARRALREMEDLASGRNERSGERPADPRA